MKSTIELEVRGSFARPIDEVRAQFADMDYHSKNNVHKALKYTMIKVSPQESHYKQEVVILGMKQVDEVITRKMTDGSVLTEVIDGANKGFRILFTFEPLPENICRVEARFTIPVTGIKKWLGPLFKVAVRKTAEGALIEDRHDLESGNYLRHYSKSN